MRWELLLYRILLIDKRILGDIFLNFLYYKQIHPCLTLYNYDITRQKCRGQISLFEQQILFLH